ncbi:hypothetical protein ACU635_08620 [[Actinomadura] parvosata]|uniref:hypothetical protein n=1 Tax=[Actinomadura] parvosata TaxID=1955412 RepID=UPI00406C2C0D
MKTKAHHKVVSWLGVIVSIAIGVGLTFLGDMGARLAGVWSLSVSLIAIIIAWRQPQSSAPAASRTSRKPRPRRNLSTTRKRIIAAASALALGAASYLLYSIIAHPPDINVGPLDVQDGNDMMEGTFAVIKVPDSAFERRFLTLRFTLQNPSGAGSCITPAEVDLIPIVDRIPRGEHTALRKRPDEPVKLYLGHARKQVLIKAVLHEADLACRVNFAVTEAVLHN